MKITASVTESSHQDSGSCYLFTLTYFFLWQNEKKVVVMASFPQQIRPLTTGQLF